MLQSEFIPEYKHFYQGADDVAASNACLELSRVSIGNLPMPWQLFEQYFNHLQDSIGINYTSFPPRNHLNSSAKRNYVIFSCNSRK